MKIRKLLFVLAVFNCAYTSSIAFSRDTEAPSRVEVPAARQGAAKSLSASRPMDLEGERGEFTDFDTDTWTDPDSIGVGFDDLGETSTPYNEELSE